MTSDDDDVVTLADIKKAREIIMTSPLNVHKTPILKDMTSYFPEIEQSMNLNMKLESMQTTGSFKIRGVVNQMANLPQEVKSGKRKLITMSAGNYGKAFAYTLNKLNLSGLCLMPLTAPSNRIALIKSLGCEVVVLPSSEMQTAFAQYAAQNFSVIHPYDDQSFITGCGSIALEILEDDIRPDVIVVCCGGGGLVSGIAAGIKQSGLVDCRIYAVEPEGSRTMYESFRKGEPVTMAVNSVASGLSPPYAGKLTYRCCRKYVEDVILVSDREILNCMSRLFELGIVAEPSGCAAMAAILYNKIPDVAGKKVVAIITGSNVSISEMTSYIQ
ncbi:L-threonine dehydratase catabolic TdcB-like isoform X2 [Saccostrea echinata]|uniref:L-threonine dehydratase catabolic TdcB-like isoform X2 n=1 Tax=Saccostrea echinata TaxID=191078 RepID=UPI002A82F9B3|nr:L-threonine dehydratase catabolic TdcB-like isoform X2 [Saccostrea echinata]